MAIKNRREFSPIIVVAVTGPAKTQAEVTTHLMGRLLRRGFRVRALRTPQEKIFSDGDIVLAPCRVEEVERLAKQLEQGWTETWLAGYASLKRSSRSVQ